MTANGLRLWGAVAAIALGLRLAHQYAMLDTPFSTVLIGDAQAYDAWARRIAAGDWMGAETFYQSPLYPYFLACLYAASDGSVHVARVVQACLGAAACVLLGLAGRTWFGDRAGLIAACGLALFPWAMFAEGLIQKSALDAFLMSAVLAAVAAFWQERRTRWLWCAGVAIGLFALNRETARVVFPVVVVWLLAGFRDYPLSRRAVWAATVTLAAAIVTVPVGVRNQMMGGTFLISTSQAGPNFYIGNNRDATGSYEPLLPDGGTVERERLDATRLAEAATGRPLSPQQVSEFWTGQAWSFIRSDPWAWMRLLGTKALLAVNRAELVDTESMAVYAEHSPVLALLSWFSFGLLGPLAICGIVLTFPSSQRSLLIGLGVSLWMTLIVFYVVDRYRFPLVPIALLCGAAGVSAWRDGITVARKRAAVAAAAAVAVVAFWPVAGIFRDPTVFNIGIGLLTAGEPAQALPWLRDATTRFPDHAEAFVALGAAHEETHNVAEQQRALEQAVRLLPNDWQVRTTLAIASQSAGRADLAIAHFREAARLAPTRAEARVNLAVALAGSGQTIEAETLLSEAVGLEPDNARISDMLVAVVESRGDVPWAVERLGEHVAARPRATALGVSVGQFLIRHRRHADAVVHARRAVAAQPLAVGLRLLLANALVLDGKRAEALAVVEQVLLDPGMRATTTPSEQERIRAFRDALISR
jgi:Flp pilus assembly protein TadD